jgi:hypothetical protein
VIQAPWTGAEGLVAPRAAIIRAEIRPLRARETELPPLPAESEPAPEPQPEARVAAPEAAEATRPDPPRPPPAPVEEPARAADEPRPTVPRVDWEKERRDAVARVIGERAAGEEGADSGRDRQPQLVEPPPPPMVRDNCEIAKGLLQRFFVQMRGGCVRDAYGDLFAAIKPDYLKARPVCAETRPEAPGALTSTGEIVSTVKCELVVQEDE